MRLSSNHKKIKFKESFNSGYSILKRYFNFFLKKKKGKEKKRKIKKDLFTNKTFLIEKLETLVYNFLTLINVFFF